MPFADACLLDADLIAPLLMLFSCRAAIRAISQLRRHDYCASRFTLILLFTMPCRIERHDDACRCCSRLPPAASRADAVIA